MKKYSIVVPTYNKIDHLKKCIDSIIKNSNMDETEIIVVSNGCKDGTWDYIKNNQYIKPIRFYDPIGFPKAVNVGIQQSDADYIVLLNNDCIILEWGKWLDILNKPFTTDKKIAVTGVTKLSFVPEMRNTIPPQNAKNLEHEDFILFYCAMISKNAINEVGLLDESLSPGIGEDIDFCMRAKKKGYQIEVTPENNDEWTYSTSFPIYHIGGLSFSDSHDLFFRNMYFLARRYKDGYYK